MSTIDGPVLAFQGTIVDSSHGLPMYIRERIIGVKAGKICFSEDVGKVGEVLHNHGLEKEDVRLLNPGQFLMPGLVDTHIHATQYRFLGNHLDQKLESWLNLYTIPNEARFTDVKLAEDVFNRAVKRTLKNGTTTAVYYASRHLHASLKLCDVVEKYGQRAFIGHVSSDGAHHYNEMSTTEVLKEAETFIETVLNKKNPTTTPVVTPGNVMRCTPQLLQSLGEMASKYNIPVQTHLCEIKDFTLSDDNYTFPKDTDCTEVLDKYNLLTEQAIMGHGIYLSEDNLNKIQKRGSSIAHCPNSNISIRSGLCDVRRVLQQRVKVGLGTDIAAGYNCSILDALRNAIFTSKVLNIFGKNPNPLTHQEAFRLATLGGCEALGVSKMLGTLEVGKEFDALVINSNAQDGPFDYFTEDCVEENIEKFLNLGDDRNIEEVYVAGKRVTTC